MEGSGGLRRKDTTKGPPLRILSLDGGGVRGYSMLIIIQELMHRTYVELEGKAPRRDQIPKPCDHFDLICGTGTGGLIAIMLGRLRLDLETCKEVYIRMTRKVFETDKTFAGIPYRSTLFKASKLEEAIKECVREHTIYENEGNDSPDATPAIPVTKSNARDSPRRHLSNASVVSFSARSPTSIARPPQFNSSKWGNANALLYDAREHRTKTAVTAIYKGTTKGGQATFLRSYDSRAEPAPEFNCTIWQAGRATSAIGLAFKPIQIGQSMFIDEGAGRYNCSDLVLDEATVNEWPGRDVGVFVSVGNGKRPAGTDGTQHLWYEDFLGEFAEARKRLISKIEGCEATHQYMLKEHLSKRGVNIENYYRFNVEVGVGEFGMNEWNRLADISTGTRRYLGKSDIQQMNLSAAAKLGKIALAKNRSDARMKLENVSESETTWQRPMENPLAVELPAEVPEQAFNNSPTPRISYESGHSDQLAVPPARPMSLQEPISHHSPRSSGEKLSPVHETSANGNNNSHRSHGSHGNHGNNHTHNSTHIPTPNTAAHPRRGAHEDSFVVNAPTPAQYATAGGADKIAIMSLDEFPRPQEPPPRRPQHAATGPPPPIPPKTPIPGERQQQPVVNQPRTRLSMPVSPLPYPDDEPPPAVNKLRKPNYQGR